MYLDTYSHHSNLEVYILCSHIYNQLLWLQISVNDTHDEINIMADIIIVLSVQLNFNQRYNYHVFVDVSPFSLICSTVEAEYP